MKVLSNRFIIYTTVNRFIIYTTVIIAGGLLGYAYWYYVGCSTGCVIGSYWYNSTVYGAVMGGLVTNFFTAKKRSS